MAIMLKIRRVDNAVEGFGFFPNEGTNDEHIILTISDDLEDKFIELHNLPGQVRLIPSDKGVIDFERDIPTEDIVFPDPVKERDERISTRIREQATRLATSAVFSPQQKAELGGLINAFADAIKAKAD